MRENTRSVWARCWLQRHLNSQQAACHSPKAGKSPGSFHSSHRCPISHTRFGYKIIISELLGFFLLLLIGASTPCWTLSLHDYTFPWECGCRAQFCPFLFAMNQHSHQVHLAGLSSSYPCTWALLGPWTALPEQCGPNYMCIYAHPRPKPSLPASLSFESILWPAKRDDKVHKIAALAVILMGLCDTTGDWSFSSDQDNCVLSGCEKRASQIVSTFHPSPNPACVLRKSIAASYQGAVNPLTCSGSDQIHSFALCHLP